MTNNSLDFMQHSFNKSARGTDGSSARLERMNWGAAASADRTGAPANAFVRMAFQGASVRSSSVGRADLNRGRACGKPASDLSSTCGPAIAADASDWSGENIAYSAGFVDKPKFAIVPECGSG